MSDDFISNTNISSDVVDADSDAGIDAGAAAVTAPQPAEKFLKRILLLCSLLLGGELIWLLVITPAMPLNNVIVSGMDSIERQAILNAAGITPRTSFFAFNQISAKEKLLKIVQVESVEITKTFPDSVKIVLTARKAVALSLATIGGITQVLVLDKNGVVFEIGKAGVLATPRGLAISGVLPIISGVVFVNPVPGLKLPEFLLPLLNDLSVLEEKSPELISVISEIQINKKTYDSYDLTVYPAYTPIKVRFGAELNENELSYMLLTLDVLRERGTNSDEIDFRSGTASFTPR
jgi:cell division protein FtsQ